MTLHRDIYWVGRQWAVTGHGLQAVDQKLKGEFDIEVSRLWEDGLPEGLQAESWLNREDFAKALSVARARYPEPPRKTAPPVPSAPPAPPEAGASRVMESAPGESPKPPAQEFNMRIEGWPAKFVHPWRARVRR